MPARGVVLGLGMIGRHHARLLQESERMELVGALDMDGDRFGSVRDPSLVFTSLDELLSAQPIDFAIVALPTEHHATVACTLAAAGVHMLIEKPLTATSAEAEEVIGACAQAGVRAAVGHVERFNPALVELRRRVNDGQVGDVFMLSTERVGPFPDRVRDVGVVKDLATHDLDLVRWLAGSPIETLAAQTAHKIDQEHEDLVSVTGRLANAAVFNIVVSRVTPTKVRQMRVVGERGMLVADTLTADLTFYANGTVGSDWDMTQDLRGVSEGDSTRYALARREPLLIELETFCDYIEGDDEAAVVTLAEGAEVVGYAEMVLESAARGETVAHS